MLRFSTLLILASLSLMAQAHATEGLNSTIGSPLPIGAGGNSAMWVMPSGNVGVGVTAPQTNLDVAGEVRPGSTGAPCSPANEGAMRYNSAPGYKVMQYCNGTAWRVVGEETAGTFECGPAATSMGTPNIACSDGNYCRVANYKTGGCACPAGYNANLIASFENKYLNGFETDGDGLIHDYYTFYECR